MPIEALYAIGIAILIGGFAYGIVQSRSRNKANDPIREQAAREIYDDPEGYEQGGKARLDRGLKSEN